MATMDIFEGDAFTIVELTRALENIPYKPALLSGSNLFSPRGVRSRTVVIESRDGTLSLIPFSERGSAYEQQVPDRREMRAFVCRQFKKQDVLWASEIQSVRDFGSESATQQVQSEVAYRLRKLRQDAETTFEYHLLNGIQGRVKDPKDHATVVNYFTEFGISPARRDRLRPRQREPGLGRAQEALPGADRERRGLDGRALGRRGAGARRMRLGLLRRSRRPQGGAGDLPQHRRRGRFARPRRRRGQLRRHHLPALPGRRRLHRADRQGVLLSRGHRGALRDLLRAGRHLRDGQHAGPAALCPHHPDRDRDEWVRLEIESNPLPICTRPQVLRSARRT
jgi:hypothetical protein